QHRKGVENVQMMINLLSMRGNIGRPGAGICPVRGHSNVQGQRTMGITEKPELVPLDKLAQQFGFEPPRDKGLNTVETCEAILKGEVRAFIGLGGNFVRAIPEREAMEKACRKGWRRTSDKPGRITASSSSSPCAAMTSSTRQSTATTTGSAEFTGPAWSC